MSYALLRHEGAHKCISNFFDELWIKIDDGVLQGQRTCLTWVDKTKLISLRIIDIFFEKKVFSLKNFLSSLIFIRMTMFFHLALLCITFVIRYGSSVKTLKLNYGLTFFVPLFDEVAITPLSLSFYGFSAWHVCAVALGLLSIATLLLFTRYLTHKLSLWVGLIMVTPLLLFDICYRWNNIGILVINQDQFGNVLTKEFTPYSAGIRIIITAINIIILPSILMVVVYFLRRVFSSEQTAYYIVRLISAIILGYLLFCYFVLFGFLANIQDWQWVVGYADFLPAIFSPIATLAIMIFAAIGIIIFIICLLFLADRIVYIVPKYKIFERDKTFFCIGIMLILISLLENISIKEIIKVIVDRF